MQKIVLFISIFLITTLNFAQTIPIGQLGTDDMLRVLQINGKIESKYSFTARPFFYNKNLQRNDFLQLLDSSYNKPKLQKSFWNNQIQLAVLPATMAAKVNTHHPYGWNDAGMIMAKGLQTMISAGVYAKIGPLSIQMQPEYYYAKNPAYNITSYYGSNSNKSISKVYLGQSSVRLNVGPVSVGASSETLWWGPGQFSSLMMSNNAPGFQHLTFNTTRPIKTPIGNFEWQLVAGKLNEDTSAAFESLFMKPLNSGNGERYYNGIIITYQPAFLPNFFLGVTRSDQLYVSDQNRKTGFIKKYLPVLAASSPEDNGNASSIPSDGSFSFFSRWILPKHQAEFYIEYGYNDFKANLRDLTTNANHSSAYIIGFNKFIAASQHSKNNQLSGILISSEIIQMAQTTSYILRNAGNWYEHVPVTQGLTYQNQILGAGSGKGNNVQILQVKKIKGFDHWGIKFQRIQQDPKGVPVPLQSVMAGLGLRAVQWNDLALGFLYQHKWNQILLNGEMQLVHSRNYGWEIGNSLNLYLHLKASYFF